MHDIEIGQLIKISIPCEDKEDEEDGYSGESVWGEYLGVDKARVDNIPFFSDIGLNDIVRFKEFDSIFTYVEIIERVTSTLHMQWEPSSEEDTKEEWEQICDYLHKNDISFESATAGMFVISVPIEIDIFEDGIIKICENCPIKLEYVY